MFTCDDKVLIFALRVRQRMVYVQKVIWWAILGDLHR